MKQRDLGSRRGGHGVGAGIWREVDFHGAAGGPLRDPVIRALRLDEDVVASPNSLCKTQVPIVARRCRRPRLIVSASLQVFRYGCAFRQSGSRRFEFRVRNATASRRSFSVGGRTIAVPARKYRLFVVLFDVRGKYTYASGRAPGPPSRGTFTIG